MYEKIYDIDNLYKAWLKVRKVSHWKERTQLYEENLLANLVQLSEELKNKTIQLGDAKPFTIHERGKERLIWSYDMKTRIAVRSFIDNVLLPLVKPKLIYDNGASVKGKGLDFHRRRLITHLQKFYKLHGNNGYILLVDFRKFFDNIDHNLLKKMFAEILQDEDCEHFTNLLIDTYAVDVSCLSRAQRNALQNEPFDSVKMFKSKKKMRRISDNPCILRRGVSIGGQLSQIAGVLYPYKLDNYIKIVRGEKFYARYMDDLYIIHKSKDHLRVLLQDIKTKCKEYKIFINEKKTQIVPINRKFTICKIQYKVDADGNIVRKPCNVTFKRERKAIRKFQDYLQDGRMKQKDIVNSYNSWRGNIIQYDCKQSVQSMDEYFTKQIGGLYE